VHKVSPWIFCGSVYIKKANDEFSGGVGWSQAEAHAARWNDLLCV